MAPSYPLSALLGVACLAAVPVAQQIAPSTLETQANLALGLEQSHVLALVAQEGPDGLVRAALEFQGQPALLELAPHSVRADDFQLWAQGADGALVPVEADAPRTLRGELIGVPGSAVAATREDVGLSARILLPEGGEYWIQPLAGVLPGARAVDHVLYSTDHVIEPGGVCGMEDLPDAYQTPPNLRTTPAAEGTGLSIAELACDADYEYFQDYGSTGAVQNRIDSVINTVNLQYESEVGISHSITTTIVRTSSNDPYSSSDAGTLLNQFRSEWNSNQGGVQRDVAQLFTGKEINGGTIGIAWVGVVCNLSYAYSMVQSDFNNSFSCVTDLSAHELGHNWSANHCNCTSFTMNPYITCANTFSPSLTIPEITSYRDAVGCLDGGGGPGGGDPTSVHVASIDPGQVGVGKGKKKGRVLVTIEDDLGNPVSGASVTGTFTGDFNETRVGTTNANGVATIDTVATKKGKLNYTFCVDSVSAGPLPYAPGDNAETCDSK